MEYGVGIYGSTAGEFVSRYFNNKARDLKASLMITESGPQGLDLVFNGSADKSAAMFRAIREALPGRDIQQKTFDTMSIFTIEGQLPALKEEIRDNDKAGARAAEMGFARAAEAAPPSAVFLPDRAEAETMPAVNPALNTTAGNVLLPPRSMYPD